MGCDIHLYVEKRENGQWVSADKWEEEDGEMHVNYYARFYTGRNYNLFAILADVRNGRGFAGIKTGEGFNPIADPRGVPDDASENYKATVEHWGCDGHSHSHFTVAELMAYDWTQVSRLQGWVDIHNFEEFERWRKSRQESPEEYSGGISGGAIQHISNEEMRALVDEVKAKKVYGPAFTEALNLAGANKYTLLEWEQPYFKCCYEFLSETLPKLWRLGKPEDVRILFFFDN